jgi:hypothetical protein
MPDGSRKESQAKLCRPNLGSGESSFLNWSDAVAVEVPQAGHATYLYMRMDMGEFVKIYAQCSRIEIRHNQGNAAETAAIHRPRRAHPGSWAVVAGTARQAGRAGGVRAGHFVIRFVRSGAN